MGGNAYLPRLGTPICHTQNDQKRRNAHAQADREAIYERRKARHRIGVRVRPHRPFDVENIENNEADGKSDNSPNHSFAPTYGAHQAPRLIMTLIFGYANLGTELQTGRV
jgi:hypothetical protein